jgi:hypothetical protein
MTDAGNIKGGEPQDWLVIGWFTPDYRPLAEKFSANLAEHGAPFHLFAKPAGQGWNTRRKPIVVLEAMDLYPGKTLVLMDVDCIVRGDISPAVKTVGDVGIVVTAQNAPKGRRARQHWVTFETSSRVVVFHPTHGARRFAQAWAQQVERGELEHDEHSMAWAFLRCQTVLRQRVDHLQEVRQRDLGGG